MERVHQELQQIQQEFYSATPKRIFFGKTAQKMECAHNIASRFSVDELVKATAFSVPHTNVLYFDYTLFKMYATPEHYEPVVAHLLREIQAVIDTHGQFELHVNLQTFSVSAAERYRDAIQLFGIRGGECMGDHLTKVCIYHTPNVIHTVARVLSGILSRVFREDIRDKVTMMDKEMSQERLQTLFSSP